MCQNPQQRSHLLPMLRFMEGIHLHTHELRLNFPTSPIERWIEAADTSTMLRQTALKPDPHSIIRWHHSIDRTAPMCYQPGDGNGTLVAVDSARIIARLSRRTSLAGQKKIPGSRFSHLASDLYNMKSIHKYNHVLDSIAVFYVREI